MDISYWCVLIAIILPYILTILAKAGAPGMNNIMPREALAKQIGWRQRAHCAQLNAFEAFPAFTSAVIIAQLSATNKSNIGYIAITFVIFRVLHGLFYIMNLDKLRSLVWFGGFSCIISLFIIAAK